MHLYNILLFVHIAGACVWIGGATMMPVFGIRATRGGPERQAAFGEDVGWIGKVVTAPASLAVLAGAAR